MTRPFGFERWFVPGAARRHSCSAVRASAAVRDAQRHLHKRASMANPRAEPGQPACGGQERHQGAAVVTPDDETKTHFPPPGSPATVATTKGGSPTKRAAAPAIDVLDDDVLDNCLGYLDAEDELLRGPIRAVASGWRAIAARCAKRSVPTVCARLAKLPGARRERHAMDAAKRLASLAGLPATHPQLNVAVALWFVDNRDGTGPLVDDTKVARQLWAFVDEVGDGAAVLNDAIDVWPHRVRAFATEVGIKRRERSAFCGKTRGGAAAAKLRGAKRCDDACSTRRAIDAVFADVLRVAREPWTLGPPPDAVSRLTGPVGKMRRFFRAFAALHGVVGGHAEIYYDRRASEPYDVTLLLPRAELAVVAHWDAEDVAGAVAGLRLAAALATGTTTDPVNAALARWQLLVDENSTGDYVVRDLDV